MAINYDKMRAVASRLITQNGKPVTLTREVKGEFDPETGTIPTTSESISGNGIFTKYSNREIDGNLILAGDRKLIFVGAEPKIDDYYGLERAVAVHSVDPNESGVIVYFVQMRK